MSRMKVALAILVLACRELNGNVVRREDASPSEVYATSQNIKKKAAEPLGTISAILETFTEGSEHGRMSDAPKNDTKSKEDNDGINNANPTINLSIQHSKYLKTPSPQVIKPKSAHYEEKRFGSRMARDTDDGETEEDVNVDLVIEENNDQNVVAFEPADKKGEVVKPEKPASWKIKANAFKPVDVHIYVHLDDLRGKHSTNSSRSWERKSRKVVSTLWFSMRRPQLIYIDKKRQRNLALLLSWLSFFRNCSIFEKVDKKEECYNKLFPRTL